jgi:aminomuconate-semialdehyde/2-hydroxymuconate-6-semialdehyde dehydrogenase
MVVEPVRYSMKQFDHYINGSYAAPIQGEYLDDYSPAEGIVYARVANGGKKDLDEAIAAAKKAFPAWSQESIQERSAVLSKLADLIEVNLERLAEVETKDTGKPISVSRTVDIPRAAANFRFFASAIINYSTEANIQEGQAVNYTRRSPLGIVGCISPWNLPLYLFTWKIAPALAMGNCVIGKPSEITPHTATLLGELATEAGLPAGVLNILHGNGADIGQLIVEHPEIKAISFTGGTATGRLINQTAARDFKKVSLELGGKNPTLVFDDCDLDKYLPEIVRSSFANQGQICLCGSRLLIQESIYDAFKERFVAEVKKINVGDPTLESTTFGAVISADHLKKIENFVESAKKDGGQVLAGGQPAIVEGLNGYFYQPTVMEGLGPECSINQQEVFGPVVTLQPFKDDDEALALANSVKYGLAASLWTNSTDRVFKLSHQLQSGIVWVNCWMHRDLRTPFGGMKESGLGREGGNEALRFFSEPQNICIKL